MADAGDRLRSFFRVPVGDPALARQLRYLGDLLEEALADARRQGRDQVAGTLPDLLAPYVDELRACSSQVTAQRGDAVGVVYAVERLQQAVKALHRIIGELPRQVAEGWPSAAWPGMARGEVTPASPLDELRASAADHLNDLL